MPKGERLLATAEGPYRERFLGSFECSYYASMSIVALGARSSGEGQAVGPSDD